MFEWLRQWRINRLLMKQAALRAYLKVAFQPHIWDKRDIKKEAEITEKLCQLGYREQNNG